MSGGENKAKKRFQSMMDKSVKEIGSLLNAKGGLDHEFFEEYLSYLHEEDNLLQTLTSVAVNKSSTGKSNTSSKVTGKGKQLTARSKKKMLSTFPQIEDLLWEQVIIEFISEDVVTVKAKGIKKKYHYSQMGFLDKRKGNKPTQQWILLYLIAKRDGILNWNDSVADSKNKKRIALLRSKLKDFMLIDDDPFYPYRKKKAYEVKFRLSSSIAESNHGKEEEPPNEIDEMFKGLVKYEKKPILTDE